MELDNFLELTDEQYTKLPIRQKLDVLYMNVKTITGMKRIQAVQWWAIGALAASVGWLFLQVWSLKGG